MSVPGFQSSVLQQSLDRACFRMAITDRSMGFDWNDNTGGWTGSTAVGTAPADAALRGGVNAATTAASGASTSGRQSGNIVLEGTALERFYCRYRWKLSTAAYATGLAGAGFDASGVWTGNDHILLGLRGATSTTLWTGKVGANVASSTISVNTSWHTGEIWCDGSACYLSVDDETPVAITASTPGVGLYAQYAVSNGGTATAQTLNVDWMLFAWAQTTT